jgi:hypothetical protein
LKPKEGEPDPDFFEIDDDIFLVQPNIMGTIHAFLGESIVPIVSRVHGESLLRCIGTGFFISCSGLLVTASHVITDPIDRKYGRTREVSANILHAPDLSFGVLIPTNSLFQRRVYILHPIEWAHFLADRRDNPLDVTGLDLESSSALRSPSLRRLAEAMDRRAELRLDQPQSTLDAPLRTLRQNRCRLRAARHDPPHAQTFDQAKPLLMNPFFLDRLLAIGNAVTWSLGVAFAGWLLVVAMVVIQARKRGCAV